MTVIGLTGGIASGKSTVAQLLQGQGFVIVDADIAARQAVAPGSEGLRQVAAAFGPDAVLNGEMNRAYIGQQIFHDEDKRHKLNSIIHPIVRTIMEEEKEAALSEGQDVIMDIPLLYENKLEETVDTVWVVYIPEKLQLERLMKRNQLSEESARARITSQISIEEKRKRADIVIDNSGTLEDLKINVDTVVKEYYKSH
ncbi:dephospho-CoA kinase [Macrococcus hajekii]|uniref:Dephospho-CoA kinase n=1 Tax=Macrococcus hajekii TaxID=198482 RepID=A0A4V3BEA3_9STAP|nr:dephospho-CoA kinase [Macrococcus hajekii]TDM02715.1 dephospho-CoA kinase [Macrococcus hajekii]GGB03295.1 dephospho-CoA kinase [Macrococcus hajekii]